MLIDILEQSVGLCLPRRIVTDDLENEPLGLSEVHALIDGQSFSVIRANNSQDKLRFESFVELLKGCKVPRTEFILNMYEGIYEKVRVSRLSYTAKPNSHHVLIPDAHCFATREKVNWISQNDIPLEEKTKTAVFGGSDTGARHSDGWTMRSLVSATYKDSDAVRAKLTFLDSDAESRLGGKVSVQEIYAPPMSLKEQISHQVVLNINGNSTSWERLLWAMASNSLCVFIKPFDGEEMYSWYYPLLESLGLAVYIEYDRVEEFLRANDFTSSFWREKNYKQRKFAQWASDIGTCRKILQAALVKYSNA